MAREKSPTTASARKRAPRKTAKAVVPDKTVFNAFVGPEQRQALIAENAYFRAEKRGFAPGYETADWLAAEAEVDAQLMQGADAPRV